MGNEPVTRYSYAVDMTLMFQLRIFVCAVVSDDDDGEDNVDYVDDGVDECVCGHLQPCFFCCVRGRGSGRWLPEWDQVHVLQCWFLLAGCTTLPVSGRIQTRASYIKDLRCTAFLPREPMQKIWGSCVVLFSSEINACIFMFNYEFFLLFRVIRERQKSCCGGW